MSSGGMDWAYRMVQAHRLDPLGVCIVMHLGWRDAPNLRTDRGIAKALNQHRSAVQYATAKLEQMGLITRRSGQWVSVETVAIVEGQPDAPRPDADLVDEGGPISGPAQSVGRGGPISGPQKAQSVGHKRKENFEKRRGTPLRPLAAASGSSFDLASLSKFQRSRLTGGQSVVVDGVTLLPGQVRFDDLVRALRDQDAEKRSR